MAILPQKDKMDNAIQTAMSNMPSANVSLTAESGAGTDLTTPAVSSRSIPNMFQYIWGKLCNIRNVLNGKQNNIPAGVNGNIVTYTGTAGTVGARTPNSIITAAMSISGSTLTINL